MHRHRTMEALLWILLPVLVAAGSAILSVFMMQARMDVALAREREAATQVRTQLEQQEKSVHDRIKAAEEAAYRRAFDQFLLEFRVEERHYVKESRSHLASRRSMVMQERLFFRNIPLSNWVEHELPIQDGTDLHLAAAHDASVFSAQSLADNGKYAPRYLPQ